MNKELRPRILVTGGCGKIGSYFVRFAANRYDIRVVDKVSWNADTLGPFSGESLVADLQDPAACRQACTGMDMVIHLAADADPDADFESSLLGNNILATYNMFRAARDAGCRRFIYASSVHAVAAYPPDVQIKVNMPVRPRNLYGVSKCFGEALTAHFAFNEGLPGIALRIGAYVFPDHPEDLLPAEQDAFLSPDDFNDLLHFLRVRGPGGPSPWRRSRQVPAPGSLRTAG
ncbi:MAG TPA: NAD(P)-dependent oxidoreductase, partial [Anaerolineales bacterium]|nr:NAD(P)-dependent oxidoreductase [Anaerolineales bacterium]